MNSAKCFKLMPLLVLAGALTLNAQVYTNKPEIRVEKEKRDSIKSTVDYPYALPILGEKAAKAGYQLPYSAGLGMNYLWTKAELVIDNLQVGFNNGPLYDLDEVVRFDKATANAQAINFRPDVWLLPFLNVYGILAKSQPSTVIDAGIYVPDANGDWQRVTDLHANAKFGATTLGFGLTPTIGVKGGWIALDMNFTWNDIPALQDPAFAFIFGPRFGKSFKLKKPDSNLAFWVGGFRLKLNSGTNGSVQLNEVIDVTGLQPKIDAGLQKVAQNQTQVNNWWNGLSSVEQKNPANVARYETANRALDAAGNFLGNLDNALNDDQYASVQYSLDKRPKDKWNFIVGSQYQISKSWMLRGEFGFLGSRTQFIGGLQFRFPL
jgi:hypothetical protein